MFCLNHKDKEATAECRYCAKGVCDECAVEVGEGRGVACSPECAANARAASRQKRLGKWMRRLTFIALSLALTAVLTWVMQRQGGPWLWFIAPFAGGGVLVTWFVFRLTWLARMKFRGAPFETGDRVLVTAGPYRGTQGKMIRRSAGSPTMVVVALDSDNGAEPHHFDWDELRKIKRKKKPSSRRR